MSFLQNYYREKLRRPLIEPRSATEPVGNSAEHKAASRKITSKEGKLDETTKEFSMPGNPTFDATKQDMQRELEKIIRGEDLPISKETRCVQEGDMEGFPIRRTCSDHKLGDDNSVDFERWNQKMNRSLFFAHRNLHHLVSFRQQFRETDDRVRLVVASFMEQMPLPDPVTLGSDLRSQIEDVFLSEDGIDPGSELMKTIGRPRNFPFDLMGKADTNF